MGALYIPEVLPEIIANKSFNHFFAGKSLSRFYQFDRFRILIFDR